MRFQFRILLGAASLLWAAHAASAQAKGRDVGKLYMDACSGCHGADMSGGKGPPLLEHAWRHGRDDDSLVRSIRTGYPENGMPAFGATINEAETRALIALIKETGTRTREPQRGEEQPLPAGPQASEEHRYRIETVAEGLAVPWSMTFLPDRSILVTERAGRLRVVRDGRVDPQPVRGLPPVVVREEAGLMSVVAAPDYAQTGWIYLTYSDPGPHDTTMNKIIRGRLRDGALVDQQVIFALPPHRYLKSYVLFGGRLAFQGPYLFFSIGERGMEEGTTGQAQKLDVPFGKIHRVFHDGTAPPDNPFVDTPGAWPSIWALGVRNPQGLAFNPVDGALWETEHGPRGGDELNHIERGRNYGWPVITYGMNYDGTPISEKTEAPGMEQPVVNWTPSIAVSEIEFYTGSAFPRWQNNLFAGSLAQQKFLRFVVDGGKVVHREQVFAGLGRVRDIKTGPDGMLYVALEALGNRPGRIVRLAPAE